MVNRSLVRVGTLFGSALALCAACSAQVVHLNKGDKDQNAGGATGDSADSGAGGGSSGSGATQGSGATHGSGASTGTGANPGTGVDGGGGSGGTYPVGADDGSPATPIANAPSTVKSSRKLDLLLMVDNSIS